MSAWSGSPSQRSTSWSASTSSSGPSRRSLRLEEPALTTRTRTRRLPAPGPVANLGQILAVLARPGPGDHAFVGHVLAEPGSPLAEVRHAIDHVHHQMEAVEVVEHHHVEGRRRRALLLVAPPMEV